MDWLENPDELDELDELEELFKLDKLDNLDKLEKLDERDDGRVVGALELIDKISRVQCLDLLSEVN